jgi:hypothetical protein
MVILAFVLGYLVGILVMNCQVLPR